MSPTAPPPLLLEQPPTASRRLKAWLHWNLPYISLLAILAVAGALRLWRIGRSPGYEWDEPVYADIARNVASGNGLVVKHQFGVPAEPYLYHPPFYFDLLAGWFKLAGTGITSARVMAACMSVGALLVLVVGFYRLYGRTVCLLAALLIATDGWMVYTGRVGWMENSLMVLVVAGMAAYGRADMTGRMRHFAVAGVVIGAAIAFKHVAVYLLLVVSLNWALGRFRNRRNHLALLGVVAGMLVLYLAGMLLIYRYQGGNYYLDETWVQVKRTLGMGEARGTVTDASNVLGALVSQYRIFYGTIALSLVGVGVVVYRTYQMLRIRSSAPIQPFGLAYSWAAGSLLFFGAINLKFPHYFLMVMVPLYLYVACEAVMLRWRLPFRWEWGVALVAVLLAANGMTYVQRFGLRSDNALADVQRYAYTQLPRDGLVLTEESVATVIPQPYCKLFRAGDCVRQARYIMIYTSRTQRPPSNRALSELVAGGRKLATFEGFKERITVYRVVKLPAYLGPDTAPPKSRSGWPDGKVRQTAPTPPSKPRTRRPSPLELWEDYPLERR